MVPPIPRRLIYSIIDKIIINLDQKKDEILKDIPKYAFMQSGIIPTNPEGGYTTLFFIFNDLEIGKNFNNEILPILQKYAKMEESS